MKVILVVKERASLGASSERTATLGLLKRNDKVYTTHVKDTKKETVILTIFRILSLDLTRMHCLISLKCLENSVRAELILRQFFAY